MFRLVSKGRGKMTGYKVSVDYTNIKEAIRARRRLDYKYKDWNHEVEIYSGSGNDQSILQQSTESSD